ncbi:MazG nucleotide pyrophosphohydrolase domain-containing protein [Francisella sp. 19X1-34]|uniref:MazG nucleotide pyrophosphohydrolase domain-containing protein n=1 Tax=Francisella sp. 19X1-34 TaxID=3087177 RepID=UPI002E2ED7BD|nr:MazG nucleotide pyrophosphohydrolase domain-containing protein [Francisella sp. 19X1-34]MED7787895.1 MazG nucleotide pyrophosphohydrolase domain-containing protein [Francisella sp. 19X1-34]
MQIKEAQDTIERLFKNISHPRLASFIALTEEVGELANEIMQKEIYEETSDDKKIKSELTDVFVCVLEIANLYNIDLELEFENKIQDLKPRVEQWQSSSKLLKSKREKLD